MRNRFPAILLAVVLLATIAASAFLIYFNHIDPVMQVQTAREDASEKEAGSAAEDASSLTSDAPPEAVPSANAATSAANGALAGTTADTAARSSTATAVAEGRPRTLPVEGEDEASDNAAEEVTLIDREAIRTQNRVAGSASHFTGVSATAPETGVSYEQIWEQFERYGQAYRYDAAYDAVEQDANAVVDDIYVEMTRLLQGRGDIETLEERLSDLESIDVSDYALSEKLIVRRSAYYLDWQNVSVAQYANDFITAYDAQDETAMRSAVRSTLNVYNIMSQETGYRYQVINTY